MVRPGRGHRYTQTTVPGAVTAPHLEQVLLGAVVPSSAAVPRPSRDQALQVAAVLRARNEIGSIATLPLRLYARTGDTLESSLLRQIDPDVANVVTLGQTLEDLLFEGVAWWRITSQDFRGYPLSARHVATTSVSLDPPKDAGTPAPLPSGLDPRGAVVWVDGAPVAKTLMIRFDSPNPALLDAARRSINRALLLDQLARAWADNPRPLDYFTSSDDPSVAPMEDEDVDGFLATWRANRKRSGTAWIPGNVKRVDVSTPSPAELQLVELQKQCTLEIANGTGIDPEDLGVSVTSRTYFNSVDRAQQKVNRTYAPYMSAITERLTMGDVTPAGQLVRFDLSNYLKPDPQGQAAYWEALQRMGVTDAEEIRGWAGLSGPPPTPAPTPASTTAGTAPRRYTRTDAGRHYVFAGGRFTADPAARTITGLAVPWGVPSSPNLFGYRTVFAPGSLEWSEPGRVKHLRDHQLPVGKAVRLDAQPEGLVVTMDVQPGADGDALLQAAVHGTYDGFSVGVEFDDAPEAGDIVVDESARTVRVQRAVLREVSTTALPAFDDARHQLVRASVGGPMSCPVCGHDHPPGVACTRTPVPAPPAVAQLPPAPAPAPPAAPPAAVQLPMFATEAQLGQALERAVAAAPPAPGPPVADRVFVDPAHRPIRVHEPEPYTIRYTRRGDAILGRGTHDLSQDLRAYWVGGDLAAGQRALTWVARQFDVATGDVNELNPPRQRPDLWVDQREYQYPVWDAINKGTLTDITPFIFPKFVSAAGLVGPHTEGVEPASGTLVTTSQTVTPTAISGKAKITREVWDQGGNPQVSTLIWNQMLRGWYEALEAAAVAALTAETPPPITLTAGGGTSGQTLVRELEAALAALQYVRGGFTMRNAFAQIDLYQGLAGATDDAGAPLLPMIGPMNRNGQAEVGFAGITHAGVVWRPAWALAPTGTVPASSYLFDAAAVHGWASTPMRLTMDMSEVAHIHLGIWGYQATAISDLAGVREVIYDPTAGVATAAVGPAPDDAGTTPDDAGTAPDAARAPGMRRRPDRR